MIQNSDVKQQKFMGVMDVKHCKQNGIAYNDPYNIQRVVNDQISLPTRMSVNKYRRVGM